MTPKHIEQKLSDIEDAWNTGKSWTGLTKTPAANIAQGQVLYLINTVRALQSELRGMAEGTGLCLDRCGMHCGYGHLKGCDAVKAYLDWSDE